MKPVLNRNRIFNRCTKVTKHGLNISVSSFHDSLESEVDAPDVIVFLVGQIEKKTEREKKRKFILKDWTIKYSPCMSFGCFIWKL